MTKQEQAMRLYKAVEKLALQAGEDTDEAIDWLCGEHGGMFKLYEAYFSPKPEQQEPVADMPSNTRYTVEVEGHGRTYWNNIHDAITCAQRAVYAGVNNTSRAVDDLKVGRIAEWSYGFSAVRIYPPQNTSLPQRKPLTDEQIKAVHFEWMTTTCGADTLLGFARAIEAAHGITASEVEDSARSKT